MIATTLTTRLLPALLLIGAFMLSAACAPVANNQFSDEALHHYEIVPGAYRLYQGPMQY